MAGLMPGKLQCLVRVANNMIRSPSPRSASQRYPANHPETEHEAA